MQPARSDSRKTFSSVRKFFEMHGVELKMRILAGSRGSERRYITEKEIIQPGVALIGATKGFRDDRIMVFDKHDSFFLCQLPEDKLLETLYNLFSSKTPCAVIASSTHPPKKMCDFCDKEKLPLFRTELSVTQFSSKFTSLLSSEFAPMITCHGTLVEVFGVGILIQGDAAVGKSETALGLIERGHRLISDDVVEITLREGRFLEGSGPKLTRHLMELRGIGIINVADMFGAVCIRDSKVIDLVIHLEMWNEQRSYERLGAEQPTIELLGISISHYTIPLNAARNSVLLVETVALNYRLRKMGYDFATEFSEQILEKVLERGRKEVS